MRLGERGCFFKIFSRVLADLRSIFIQRYQIDLNLNSLPDEQTNDKILLLLCNKYVYKNYSAKLYWTNQIGKPHFLQLRNQKLDQTEKISILIGRIFATKSQIFC